MYLQGKSEPETNLLQYLVQNCRPPEIRVIWVLKQAKLKLYNEPEPAPGRCEEILEDAKSSIVALNNFPRKWMPRV